MVACMADLTASFDAALFECNAMGVWSGICP